MMSHAELVRHADAAASLRVDESVSYGALLRLVLLYARRDSRRSLRFVAA
jgi:hypothetical protein